MGAEKGAKANGFGVSGVMGVGGVGGVIKVRACAGVVQTVTDVFSKEEAEVRVTEEKQNMHLIKI